MRRLTAVIIAFFFLIIFGNFFFFRTVTAFSIGIFLLGVGVFIIFTSQKISKIMWALLGVVGFEVFVLATRAANFVQIESVLTILSTIAIVWYLSLSEGKTLTCFTDVFLSPVFAGLTYAKRSLMFIFPKTVIGLYKQGITLLGDKNTHSKTMSTLVGVGFAIPTVVILLSMFSAADPIYYSFLKKIISPDFLIELPWRIFFSIVLAGLALPLIYPTIKRVYVSPSQIFGRLQISRELTIVMIAVAVIIGSFIAIQWSYIFANVQAETDLSQFGVATYAEYVKKGFVELLRVCVFIYGLLWLGLTILRQTKEHKPKFLSGIQWLVMGEFLIVLVSIFRRVYLYQSLHGLTLIRVYGTFFLIWLLFMTITMAGRHMTSKIRFGQIEGIFSLILFVIIGMWNVESYIVTYHPPTVNNRTDYVYLSRMSADGIFGWIKAYEAAKQTLVKYSSQPGSFEKNSRREIAYAYYIIRKLTYQYFDYMPKYATESEYREYLDTITNFQINRMDKEYSELSMYKLAHNETWVTNRMREIESTKKKPSIVIYSQQDLPIYEPITQPRLMSFYDSFVKPDSYKDRFYRIKALDRWYLQNSSDEKAFILMKENIPLSELHELQIKYFELYTKIEKQMDRDYEKDVSLASPLL